MPLATPTASSDSPSQTNKCTYNCASSRPPFCRAAMKRSLHKVVGFGGWYRRISQGYSIVVPYLHFQDRFCAPNASEGVLAAKNTCSLLGFFFYAGWVNTIFQCGFSCCCCAKKKTALVERFLEVAKGNRGFARASNPEPLRRRAQKRKTLRRDQGYGRGVPPIVTPGSKPKKGIKTPKKGIPLALYPFLALNRK